jgi:Uncharacterized protein conserved in bacteria (DUF2252)
LTCSSNGAAIVVGEQQHVAADTGSAAAITGYLGKGDSFDKSLGQFALAYAKRTVRDHKALVEAIDTDRVPAIIEEL